MTAENATLIRRLMGKLKPQIEGHQWEYVTLDFVIGGEGHMTQSQIKQHFNITADEEGRPVNDPAFDPTRFPPEGDCGTWSWFLWLYQQSLDKRVFQSVLECCTGLSQDGVHYLTVEQFCARLENATTISTVTSRR